MLPEASMAETNLALDDQAANAGDENLLVKFFKKPKQDMEASKEEGRPIFKEATYVSIIQPGNKENMIQRPASQMDIDRFPEHYRRFEARTEEEYVEGTLLEEWPGCTRSQVEELRFFHVRTVEQLAGMSDANTQGKMGLSMLKQKAIAYLETSQDEALVEQLAEAKADNERLASLLEETRERLDALEAAEEE